MSQQLRSMKRRLTLEQRIARDRKWFTRRMGANVTQEKDRWPDGFRVVEASEAAITYEPVDLKFHPDAFSLAMDPL